MQIDKPLISYRVNEMEYFLFSSDVLYNFTIFSVYNSSVDMNDN